jgi:outer membrane protein assembly factor BamB
LNLSRISFTLICLFAAPFALAFPPITPFTFIHLSDPHVGAGDNAATDARLFKEISDLPGHPAFVAGTGDCCENGTPAQYAQYQDCLKSLTIPMHMAPGNHDVRWNPTGKEGFQLGAKQPLYQSWDYDGVHFVLLDSTVLLEHWGHFDQSMLDWLKSDLQKTGTETPIIIGFHHGIGYDAVFCDNEQQLMELVEPYNVRLWLQGHGHADIQWNVNGVPAIECKGTYQESYNIITITPDHLTVTRRFLAPKKQTGELIGNSEATETIRHKEILTIPLKKPTAPQWDASLTSNTIHISRGNLPTDSGLAYRLNETKYLPMTSDSVPIDTAPLVAGEHLVTVQATLPDGRAYQKPLKLIVTKPGAPTPLWTQSIGGAVQSTLVRDRDTLYITTMGGDLCALNAASGSPLWQFHTQNAIFATPVVADNHIYIGSADHNIYCIDSTGHETWHYSTAGGVFGSPIVSSGVVAAASVDKKIYGLDSSTGALKWTAPIAGMYQSKPATDGVHFFFAGWDNHLRCIDAASGKELWSDEIGKAPSGKIAFPYSPAIASPTVGDGQVFVTSNDGVLHAVAIDTGHENWSFSNKRLGYSGPLFHDHKVYVVIGDPSKIFCLDARTGQCLWMTGNRNPAKEQSSPSSKATTLPDDIAGDPINLPVIYDSSPAIASHTIFVGSVDGTFNAIDADTGKIAWQYRLGTGHLLDSPATDDHAVYISSLSGKVTALPITSK